MGNLAFICRILNLVAMAIVCAAQAKNSSNSRPDPKTLIPTIKFNRPWVDVKFGPNGDGTNQNGNGNGNDGSNGFGNSGVNGGSSGGNKNGRNKNGSGNRMPTSVGSGAAGRNRNAAGGGADDSGSDSSSPPRQPQSPANGDPGSRGSVEIPTYWLPYCFLADRSMPADQINAGVKAMVDAYGKCDISLQPYVFKVKDMPTNPDEINSLAKKVCPLNDVFHVAGSGVQSFPNSNTSSDLMCKNLDEHNQPKSDVAGCSELGNGAGGGGGGILSSISNSTGNYGAQGEKGKPAASIVDVEAWGSAGVWCHESGHSIGGPGRGGDYLVNKGDGRPQPQPDAGLGLEGQGKGGSASLNPGNDFQAAEGGDDIGQCNFTGFGCESLRGGSNINIDKYVWEKDREEYYSESPGEEPTWEMTKGKSFFDPPDSGGQLASPRFVPPPRQPPAQEESLVFNETAKASKGPSKTPGEPFAPPNDDDRHKKRAQGAIDNLLTSLRGADGKLRKKRQVDDDDSDSRAPVIPATSSSASDSGGLVFNENAKKANVDTESSGSSSASFTPSSSSSSGGSSSGGLVFNESVAKAGGVGAAVGGRSGSRANRSSADPNVDAEGDGKPKDGGLSNDLFFGDILNGLKKPGSGLDDDFFGPLKKEEKQKKRVRGEALRKNQPSSSAVRAISSY